MRVLLVSLPNLLEDQPLYPLGIGYLIGSLRQHHEVATLHFSCMDRVRLDLRAKMISFQPQVVGLTCSTFNRGSVRRIIHWIRNRYPTVKIIAGGVHASYCYEQVINSYGADAVVIGEGDETILELCAAFETNKPLSTVQGIAYKEATSVKRTAPRSPIHDLDRLPLPDYTYAESAIRHHGMAFLITSRGCPARCKFCSTSSFWGQHVRTYSPKRVADEMEMLVSRFGVRRLFFHDDTFNLGFARVQAVCQEIVSRRLNVEWGCSCRVVPASEEMIATMVNAGCRHIGWGIESGSARILETINKKITVSQIRKAFDLCLPYSNVLSTGAFVMIGNPGEDEESIRETVDFLGGIPMTDRPAASILYVLPGTELYDSLKNNGHIHDSDWVKYDTVPAYTLEHSYWTLLKWSTRVNRSVRTIPFDQRRHFWRVESLPGYPSVEKLQSRAIHAVRHSVRHAMWVAIGLRKLLPGRRLRF